MELQRETPPAYDTAPLTLPDAPKTELSPPPAPSEIKLPDLQSLGLPPSHSSHSYKVSEDLRHHHQWQNGTLSNAVFPSVPTALPRASVESTLGSPLATESIMSMDRDKTPGVVSMDDPETRMAAEALSGLRNLDFVRSPSARSATLSISQINLPPEAFQTPDRQGESEPLLQLVTANHPWLGATINGSLSTYNISKNISPAFIRNGAEFVERTIGSPIANTVASVSNITGVEGGLRRYLGDRRPSDLGDEDSRRRKRMRQSSPETDIERGLRSPPALIDRRSRAGSQASLQSLPPYDETRSPRYSELPPPLLLRAHNQVQTTPPPPRNWRTQLMITTSGLGAALSEASLKNLRLCLHLLRMATEHLGTVMHAITQLLDDYNRDLQGAIPIAELSTHNGFSEEQEEASRRIASRITEFHRDIMHTLENVKNSISNYTGSALPENAGALVRRQLMSIPQRWKVAESAAEAQENGITASEPQKSGNKLLAFTGQSLDMIAQVTLIVGATIENAESWLETMGKRKGKEKGDGGASNNMKAPAAQHQDSLRNDEKDPNGVALQSGS
ncbi:Opi1-domain-containing protein [Tothia fuscella]|uniref:Opi1-domain-containing protein n=1 Tax=Tothia fuscella TaxID=1048955 RepID=A0A9P4U5J9_9PEZI|nr:Opi1-domain-containing protein [Tothia fuscella]